MQADVLRGCEKSVFMAGIETIARGCEGMLGKSRLQSGEYGERFSEHIAWFTGYMHASNLQRS